MAYTLGQTITVITQSALISTWTNEVKKPAQTVQAEITKVGRGLALAGNGKNTHVVEIAEATVIEDNNVAEQFQTYTNLEGTTVTVGSSHRCGTYYGSNRNGWESQSNSHFFSEAPATCKNCNPNAKKDTPLRTKLDEILAVKWHVSINDYKQNTCTYDSEAEARADMRQMKADDKESAKRYKGKQRARVYKVHAPLG